MNSLSFAFFFRCYDIKRKNCFVKQEVVRQLVCVKNDCMLSFAYLHRLTQWINRFVTAFSAYFLRRLRLCFITF